MKFIFLVLLILSTPVLAKRTYSEHDGMSKPKDEVCKGIREKKITSCRQVVETSGLKIKREKMVR